MTHNVRVIEEITKYPDHDLLGQLAKLFKSKDRIDLQWLPILKFGNNLRRYPVKIMRVVKHVEDCVATFTIFGVLDYSECSARSRAFHGNLVEVNICFVEGNIGHISYDMANIMRVFIRG